MNQAGSADKTCPFCAETVLAAALKCKHCGEYFDARANRDGSILKVIAVTGCLLLAATPFAPLASVPLFGRITLFSRGDGDGWIVLATALLGLGCALATRYRALWISGLVGLFEICNLLYVFQVTLPQILANYKEKM